MLKDEPGNELEYTRVAIPVIGTRVRYFTELPGATGRIIDIKPDEDKVLVYFGFMDGSPKSAWVALENLVEDDIEDPEIEAPELPVESLPEPESFSYAPDPDPDPAPK